ncbi:MAG: hypothetical protein ABIA08_02545 [bacterium]
MKLFVHKIELLKKDLKEAGLKFAFGRIVNFLLRPLYRLINRNQMLIEFCYSTLPNLKQKLPLFQVDSGMIKLPKSELIKEVRKFWYSNIPGDFDLNGEKISRKDIFTYGGPNPKFTCPVCQKSEWLSRVRQKNLFIPHNCSQVRECEDMCKKQGDELWTNFHQNFDFSIGCDSNLPAPRCLFIGAENKYVVGGNLYSHFQNPASNSLMHVLRRRLAYTCQVDVVSYPIEINWGNYDFVFLFLDGYARKFPRPPVPLIVYGHDFGPSNHRGAIQWMIDWLKPDILLAPCPIQWKEYFKLSPQTEIVFYPFFDSLFFARPNLNEKKLDLLAIGNIESLVNEPRAILSKQISKLSDRYKIEFSHQIGVFFTVWKGPVYYSDPKTKSSVRYLNKWSEYLGTAKYVIFGRCQISNLVMKHYETLGSGAIPIFPEVQDLRLLGVKPFEHYIPLSEVEGNNEKLVYYLDNYEKYKYIAENAVNWYKKNSDKMIFNDFEDLIKKTTKNKYSKRLI